VAKRNIFVYYLSALMAESAWVLQTKSPRVQRISRELITDEPLLAIENKTTNYHRPLKHKLLGKVVNLVVYAEEQRLLSN